MPQEKKEQGFSMFLQEKAKNKAITNDFVNKCYPQWKKLSEKEQNKYKAKAEAINRRNGKLDSFGNSVKEREEDVQDQVSKENIMKECIAEFVRKLGGKQVLMKEIFNVICINHYVFFDESGYIPAEVGICQFSVKEGILKSYCKILPAILPHGASYEAKQHSESTHKIPLTLSRVLQEESSQFESEISNIFSYKMPRSDPLYLFTQRDFQEAVSSVMKEFNLPLKIVIWPLDLLVQNMLSLLVEEISESQATSILKNCCFQFNANISCMWHQREGKDGVHYCALNYVHRWIYNIFESIDIEKISGAAPVEGKHKPPTDSSLLNEMQKLKVNKKSKKKGKKGKGNLDSSLSLVVDDSKQDSSQKLQSDNEYCTALYLPSAPQTFNTNSEDDFPSLGLKHK